MNSEAWQRISPDISQGDTRKTGNSYKLQAALYTFAGYPASRARLTAITEADTKPNREIRYQRALPQATESFAKGVIKMANGGG